MFAAGKYIFGALGRVAETLGGFVGAPMSQAKTARMVQSAVKGGERARNWSLVAMSNRTLEPIGSAFQKGVNNTLAKGKTLSLAQMKAQERLRKIQILEDAVDKTANLTPQQTTLAKNFIRRKYNPDGRFGAIGRGITNIRSGVEKTVDAGTWALVDAPFLAANRVLGVAATPVLGAGSVGTALFKNQFAKRAIGYKGSGVAGVLGSLGMAAGIGFAMPVVRAITNRAYERQESLLSMDFYGSGESFSIDSSAGRIPQYMPVNRTLNAHYARR